MKKTWSVVRKIWFVLLLLMMVCPSPTRAQVLNQQINALLANNCAGLGTTGFPTPNLTGLGPNLRTLCDVPETNGAVSAGGGAASVQGSAASILNRTLLGRLEELKNEGRDTSSQPLAMRFNPFGLMSLATLRDMSISSPFYAATSTDAGSTGSFATSTHRRWNGLGLFATGQVESLNREITTYQDGYKSRILGFSAGVDYRFSKQLVAGLVGSFSNTDGDFRGGGTFNTNSYGVLAFAQLLPTDRTFIQGTAGYTRNDYSVDRLATANIDDTDLTPRLVNSTASSNSKGNVLNLGALAGYDHPIGRFLIGPRVGVNYSRTHIGDYAESGGGGIGLRYNDQFIHSLQSTVGLQGSTTYSVPFGVLVHQVNADYVHEFANSQRFIGVQFTEDLRASPTKFAFQNEVPVRNYAYVGTGLVAVLPNGWQPFINFRAMVGNSQFDNYAGTFGVRVAL